MMYGTQVPKLAPGWSSGLCSCLEDVDGCIYGTLCTGCLLMKIQAKLDQRRERSSDSCIGCLLTVSSCYALGWVFHGLCNLQMRERFEDEYEYKDDCNCLKAFFCLWCSTCQMDREIKHLERVRGTGKVPKPVSMV